MRDTDEIILQWCCFYCHSATITAIFVVPFLSPWKQHVEACLFAFRSIAEGGDYGDDQCAANLLRLIGQINMSHAKLASTALYMLGMNN